MESTSIELLRDSVYEENENVRLAKISKACKKISEILPFVKKRHIILEQRDLITYLLLSIPLFGNSIDLLLESLFDCFSTNETFLLSFYKGIDYIACNLKELPEESPNQFSPRISNVLLASVLEKIHLNQPKSLYKLDFCKEILQNKGKIKGKTLDYANRLFTLLFKGKYKRLIPEKIDLLGFFLNFSRNNFTETIIIKTCRLIAFWKEKWPVLWGNTSFEMDLQEILLQKRTLNPLYELNEQESPFVPHVTINQVKALMEDDLTVNEEESPSKKPHFEILLVKTGTIEELLDEDDKRLLKRLDEHFAEEDEENKNILIIQIENWLCQCNIYENSLKYILLAEEDPPLIGKNEYISHFFKIHENFKLLLALILDPFHHPPSNCWVKKYPNILKSTPQSAEYKDILLNGLSFRQKQWEKDKISAFFNVFNFRSYKVMRMICDLRNFRHIYKANNTIVQTYFACVYSVLLKEETLINMNHVAKLTEYFLKRNQDLSLNLIFHYNLLFKFLQFLLFPCIRDLLTYFLGSFYHQTRLTIKNQHKLWKYLHFSLFFQDLATILLKGSLSSLDQTKSSDLYKAIDIEINIDESKQDDTLENEPKILIQVENKENNTVLEELTGFRTDIDRIKGSLHVKGHIWARKRLAKEMMVIRAFKSGIKGDTKEIIKENDSKKAFVSNFIRKIETVRLTEYIKVPLNKEEQLKASFTSIIESPVKSPLRSSAKNKSILLTRPPLKSFKSILPSLSKENSSIISSSMMDLTKKKEDLMGKILKKSSITPFNTKGYLIPDSFVINELPIEGIIKRKTLYPLSQKDLFESKLDKKAKKITKERIEESDRLFGLYAAELLCFIIKNTIENYDNLLMKKVIEFNGRDYSLLLVALLKPGNTMIYKLILENYLLKIKYQGNPVNSAFLCGETVNLILSHLNTFTLKEYSQQIQLISEEAFPFLCKLLLSSYYWENPSEITIQSFIIDDTLMSTRLLLITTFQLILKQDIGKKVIDIVPDALWDALLTWFFDKKHNNLYQRAFYSIMEQCFKVPNEFLSLRIACKLNLIGSIHESLEQIYKNEVRFMKIPLESFFCFIIKLIKLIESCLKSFPINGPLNRHIKGLSSWRSILRICHREFEQDFPHFPSSSTKKPLKPHLPRGSSPQLTSPLKTPSIKAIMNKTRDSLISNDSSKRNSIDLKIIKENQRKSKFLKKGSGEDYRSERTFGLNGNGGEKGINRTLNDLPEDISRRKIKKNSLLTNEDLI